MKHFPLMIVAATVPLFAGCGSSSADSNEVVAMRKAIASLDNKPEHKALSVTVQHILIAFKGSDIGKPIARSREEAEQLAAELFAKIQAGADFGALVRQHSDDSPLGKYTMTLNPAAAMPPTTLARKGMVPGFGHVGWRLEVGEVGVAPYDPVKSQYGWHIIKRLR